MDGSQLLSPKQDKGRFTNQWDLIPHSSNTSLNTTESQGRVLGSLGIRRAPGSLTQMIWRWNAAATATTERERSRLSTYTHTNSTEIKGGGLQMMNLVGTICLTGFSPGCRSHSLDGTIGATSSVVLSVSVVGAPALPRSDEAGAR